MADAMMTEMMTDAPHHSLTEAEIDRMVWDLELDAAASLETCTDYDGDDSLAGLCL